MTDRETKSPGGGKNSTVALADIRLAVDFSQKDEAKKLGARWDGGCKTWYAPKGADMEKLKGFTGGRIMCLRETPLYIYYEERTSVKNAGGYWDAERRGWFLPPGSDMTGLPNKFFFPREEAKGVGFPHLDFADFAISHGLILEGLPEADGKFHRVPVVNGKPGAKDGSYIYFDDDKGRAGWIKNFKTGFEGSFGENGQGFRSMKTLAAQEKEARNAEREKAWNDGARKAAYLVKKIFKKAARHPYLTAKGIMPHGALTDKYGALIIPLTDIEGRVTSFQRILADGSKTYMRTGKKFGSFFLFGALENSVIICEGFATGASLYEACGIPVAAAMDGGNMTPVAEGFRKKFGPGFKIILAADNDRAVKGNPGAAYAKKAARLSQGSFVAPFFNEKEMAQNLTDFNDLASSAGLEEVRRQIKSRIDWLKGKNPKP